MDITPKQLDALYDSVQLETMMNREDNSLPFGYYHPQYDGKVMWICDYDKDGQIISIVSQDHGSHKDKQTIPIKDMEQAVRYRDLLIGEGWKKIKPPEVTVKRPDGTTTPLSRSEKRYLKRKISKMDKKTNPFRRVTDESSSSASTVEEIQS